MSKEVIECIKRHWYEHAAMIVSIVLMISSFIVPPTGIIDGSVLMGAGELIAGAAILSFLSNLPDYIKAGATARISKGDLNLELKGKGDQDNE